MLEDSKMTYGDDGALDANGNPLPTLSKSSSKMKIKKLLNTPLPTFNGRTPGSYVWTNIAYFLMRKAVGVQYRTFEVSGSENIPRDRGSLCCAWHTNGLLDPAVIMVSHPKRFVIGGRHDLVTRPILGFWARKLAVQPVVRQAELVRGGCTPEIAAQLNGRSLLKLSTGIASGFGCFLFPEGTSHDESHLIRIKTGPMRTALSSVSLAKAIGKTPPVILPVGLHWRVRHYWRTDAWVEYGEPIIVDDKGLGSEMSEKIASGEWVEPPKELVNNLRDKVRERMTPLTPDAPDWETNRGWHLLGHLNAHHQNAPLRSWRDEVIAARKIRDEDRQNPNPQFIEKAVMAAQILEDNGLDGRSVTNTGKIHKQKRIKKLTNFLWMVAGLLALPLSAIVGGAQAIVGYKLGNSNIDNEGLDARTSFQFLASLFGSFFFWPPMAVIGAILLYVFDIAFYSHWFELFPASNMGFFLSTFLAIFWIIPIFWISIHVTVRGWDAMQDYSKGKREKKLRVSSDGEKFESLCGELINDLNSQSSI